MTEEPMLVLPDHAKPYEEETDTFDFAIGGVLMQDGHPVAFESRKLNEIERHYTVQEKEMIAVVHCLHRFTNYFSKYGEIADSVIMMDKYSGRPRVADKVLEECHVIDGREVEVKRTIPREDMEGKSALRTKKIFVGGLPAFLSEDELKEYFSFYGGIVEHQIMLDHTTGRSRGFGFVTFAEEDAVERIISEGKVHELGGKQVEIKKAEPKRGGSDYSGSQSKFRGSFNNSAGGYAKEYYPGYGFGGKVGRNFGGGYGGFDSYGMEVILEATVEAGLHSMVDMVMAMVLGAQCMVAVLLEAAAAMVA
ncbi:heterogeneous nuclear ribonucleoprotein 1-like [Syzygium oleosum]|uniref:heterogeneous nuclear ribonucleoprotein 1-like n=1 Tax=Syzygium oleosum TaxID=219896 RepID=UPI0024BB6AC6|nr:heterogeneous nuclear ribonucleoprotein 1-like [Syzygium oleosum]